MRIPAKLLLGLLPVVMTACMHKAPRKPVPAPPPPVAVPQPQPETKPVPPVPAPELAQPAQSSATPAAKPSPAKPVAKPKPSAAHYPQQNRMGAAPVSAMGQLSTGDSASQRQQVMELLTQSELRLSRLNRTLSTQEQRTAGQVREYLKQARRAFDAGDLDGAGNLAGKARTLLGELAR